MHTTALMQKLTSALLKMGVPQEVVDKLAVIEHKAGEIALMCLVDAKEDVINFINAEYAKIVDKIRSDLNEPPTPGATEPVPGVESPVPLSLAGT